MRFTTRPVILHTLACAFTLASSLPATAGLVAWWKFDDAPGSTTAADSSGNPSPATATLINGPVMQPANGRFGGAMYLDGVNDYAEVPDRADMRFPVAQSFTLALWFKSDGDEASAPTEYANGLNQGLITKAYPGGTYSPNYFQLQITAPATTGQSYFVFDSRISTAAATPFRRPTALTLPDAVDNNWHHLVAVMNRSTGVFTMYVDGAVYHTVTTTSAAGGGQWDMGSTAPLVIGNHQNRYCRGWFDDIGIWNNALTAAEVTSIYTNGISLGNDTDNDGLVDTWETTYFGAGNLSQTASGDPDTDGLTNLQEQSRGTNPTLADTDGDGLTDGNEVNVRGTNPLVADTDGDGLSDGVEVNTHGTNPLLADTDGDTYSDGAEIIAGTNPLNASSYPPPPAFNVHINEFMANSSPKANDPTAPLDMDGDSQDWIEIKNNEATAVNLQGYQLSDNAALPAKYTLPSFSIPAGGYALVYASGKDRHVNGVQPHTNFSLGTTGVVILTRPTAGGPVTVSQIGTALVPYPSQHRYTTYGPADNLAASTPGFMTGPTPGTANNAGSVVTGFVADTTFTAKRGIYSAPFSTTIGCTTPGATIVYTLNGSVPTATNGTQIPPLDSVTPPTGNVNITATTLLRARAIKTGLAASDVDTQSYIFTADVMSQNAPTASMGLAPGDTMAWGTGGGTPADISAFPGLTFWGINTALASDAVLDNRFAESDLKNIATISLVASWKELFGPSVVSGDGGIYPPATGVAAEGVDRAASIEMINPDGSVATPNLANGFQADGNVHIFGGTSQTRWKSYKLSFRFQCLNNVNFRAYGNDAYNSFDNFILDARINNTWMHPTDANQRNRSDFVNDQVVADLQNKVSGRGGFHNRPVHLYLNGVYWGVYFLHEKPDHHFAAAYYGGNAGDYDVFKHSLAPDFTESDPLVNASYVNPALPIVKPSGGNPAGNSTTQANYEAMLDLVGAGYVAPNPAPDLTIPANFAAVATKLDIDDFIDYMMINFLSGNQDWSDKNLYASYNRAGGGKWRFHSWDAEHTYRTGAENFITGLGNETNPPHIGQPKTIHNKLKVNAEYRLKFADHIRKQMFNTGALTPTGLASAFAVRLNEIDSAIRGESARWGHIRASLNGGLAYKKSNWLTRKNSLITNEGNGNSLLQNRWNLVMQPTTGIFRTELLYPTTAAPDFSQHGGSVSANYPLTISNPNGTGTVYYTLDGTDPRVTGGAVSGTAQTYGVPVVLATSGTVKSRVLLSGVWSALNEAYFSVGTVPASAANIVVSEFSYNPSLTPPTPGYTDPNDFEYIELLNISGNTVDFTDCEFTSGVTFHFNNASIRQLAPGARLIIAENPAALAARHGSLPIAGSFELDTNLSNNGETITLIAADHVTPIRTFDYKDSGAWPVAADGQGFSLVLLAPFSNPNHDQAESWRTSATANNGSPGGSDIAGYAAWKTTNNLPDEGDTDGDGYINLLEYVLGTNPNAPGVPSMSAAVQSLTVNGIPGNYFTFTFTHAPATDDVTWRVEMSTDLASWSAAPSATQRVTLVVNGDGSVTETWRSGSPESGIEHFARIYASRP